MSARPQARRWSERLRLWAWKAQRPFVSTLTFNTLQGRFSVDANDAGIGRQLYCQRQFELDLIQETFELTRRLGLAPPPNEGAILDIGANIGVISVGAVVTGQVARGVAIEPEPRNFQLLERNVANNHLQDQIVRLQAAVSDSPGELEFELSESNFGDHRVRKATASSSSQASTPGAGAVERYGESRRKSIRVRAARLDDLCRELPALYRDSLSLVWIDVQGFEAQAFRGGVEVLGKGVPVMVEIWPYGMQRAGTSVSEFCELASRFWRHYWVRRDGGYVSHPIATLNSLLAELGGEGGYDNAIFTT
ncbi:MAG: FkbM family methyltransferase [Pirellulales bacterium]